MISVTITASTTRFSRLVPTLQRALRTALRGVTKTPVHVGFFLISDAEMRRINRRTRGKDRATNVLSFEETPRAVPHPELPKGTRAQGEIFLAPDYIARKKEDPVALAIHGLLHLFGYTHAKARDRMRMERKERALLAAVRQR